MSLKKKIDGSEATSRVQRYFSDQYGSAGVVLFEVERAYFDKENDKWVVKCSFYRTMLSPMKSMYTIEVYSDGTLGNIVKEEKTAHESEDL